jgi:hypothetical protein
VAAAADGDLQIVLTGEAHGGDDVGGAEASGDESRAPVDGAVPDGAGAVVVGVIATDQPAPEAMDLGDSWPRAGVP